MDALKNRIVARAIISAGSIATLAAVVGAGRKWH